MDFDQEDGKNMMMKGIWVNVVVLVTIAIATKLVLQLWWRPRKVAKHYSNQGIKGPPYNIFIGNMKELVEMMLKASSQPMTLSHNILPRVLPFYHHWKKLYGATYLIWFGPTPRLTIADPGQIREILSTKAEFYEKYESHPLVKKLEGHGLISLKGDVWVHRRKTISPIFHLENLKMMIPIMGKSVAHMLDKWSLISNSGKVELEVSEWFQNLTEEVITRTIFGASYDDGKKIYQLQAKQIVFAAESFQKVFFPGQRFLPTKRNRTTWKLDREIEASLMKLISQRKESLLRRREEEEGVGVGVGVRVRDGGEGEECHRDLLEILIEASMSNNNNKNTSEKKITDNDIVEECKSFFFAGKHTTSNLLIWTSILLAMHPQWQQLAREEVMRVCGARDIPTKDDVSNLKTLSMIISEVLRLYPPVVATIRRAKTQVDLGDINIKEETELLVPILAVHHDTTIWGPDASEFNPSRFSQGVSRAATHPTTFMPFGLGGRQCIGQNLALLQAKLAIAMILQKFTFEISPNYKHAPTVLMLLYPQFGAPIIFRSL
ncbi:cytochrome P450 734A1-like [Chenopodium quinoa]|uniref:cytochrome P450 734A1-like n=1 Tax=Chenopodium quinoa TaxID=63459 RepID=UPI000B78A03C|nr:cytochrome P450 734A1-like [Chenopodium quinoa]